MTGNDSRFCEGVGWKLRLKWIEEIVVDIQKFIEVGRKKNERSADRGGFL
jgi:hypothetical protein